MAAQKKQITLLPGERFQSTTLGRALSWTLTAGRVIVVLTELAVILAFISRFWFDRTLTNLNEQITQKVHFISANRNFEEQYRRVQTRLSLVKEITAQDSGKIVSTILAQVPAEVKIDQVSITPQTAQITGLALSEAGIELFTALIERAGLGGTSIKNLSAEKEQVGTKFTIVVTLKGAQNAK